MKGFLVSERYENLKELEGRSVFRIERHKEQVFDLIVNTVRGTNTRGVSEELKKYDVKTVVEIAPWLYDAFFTNNIKTDRCKISKDAFIAESAEIFADETSEIIIEEGVTVFPDTVIHANENSRIFIGKNTRIESHTCISIYGGAVLTIGEQCLLRNLCSLDGAQHSYMFLGNRVALCERVRVVAGNHGKLHIGDCVTISNGGVLGAAYYGEITIGDGTSVNDYGYLGAAKAKVRIGKDNMLSFFVKMDTGAHELIELKTGNVRTNRKDICTEDHVWIGMGATLLPGCYMGEGSVIGAASVVNRHFPSHCTVAGNPAHILHEGISWQREEMSS